jgi:Beta-lactamase
MHDSVDFSLQGALAAVSDEKALRARLDELATRKGLQDVCVGISIDGRKLMLAAGAGSAQEAPVAAGCLAKLLTAMLVTDLVIKGRIGWNDLVAEVLACSEHGRQQLAGITVRHLLDHTHGLDASAIPAVPRRDDGFIDVECLSKELTSPTLFPAGRMYSYSNAGSWLAAAMLEGICGVRYASQLREQQLIFEGVAGESMLICPATGADLTLTVEQWLAFAQRYSRLSQQPRNGLQEEMKLPGWHPAEHSICRGWKYYGDGWLGHNANLPDRSAILRVNPREQLAILVSANGASGAVFAALGLFAELLPEFRNIMPPRLLRAEELVGSSLQDHVGRYVQARAAVDITMDANGTLQLCVHEGLAGEESSPVRRLRAAERGVFLAESAGHPEFLFVQFIANEASSPSAFLWNGRQVWRRAVDPDVTPET